MPSMHGWLENAPLTLGFRGDHLAKIVSALAQVRPPKDVDPEDQELFGPWMAPTPFHYIAFKGDAEIQNQIKERLTGAGYRELITSSLSMATARRSMSPSL